MAGKLTQMKSTLVKWLLCAALVPATLVFGQDFEAAFTRPGDSTKPYVYWYWISDNISREGITRDLEAMARAGIGAAYIGNVDVNKQNRGTVKVLTPEWWSLVEHAVHEGKRVGVKIGTFNCPGWSQSGGPWVKPEQSMRYLAVSETRIQGPRKFQGKLPAPKQPFQDVAVLAFPAPAHDQETEAVAQPTVTSQPAAPDAANLMDGKLDTVFKFPSGAGRKTPLTVDAEFSQPFTARSVLLHPGPAPFLMDVELQAQDGSGQFQSVRKFRFDRSNQNPSVGAMVNGPVAISFLPVTSRHYRFIFTGVRRSGNLAEIELTTAPRLERFVEKQLGKMFQTPLPMWGDYLWPAQPGSTDGKLAIRPREIRNLSAQLGADGSFEWNVPRGEWVVLRVGMTPTGVENSPASPEGRGLEIDKMSKKLVSYHFRSYVGQLLERLPQKDRDGLQYVIADSYEMGSENWTDGFDQDFRKRYGYDPLTWLPVLTGRIVGSADQSDRFLWDLRRLVADRISYEYVGGLREEAEKHGLKLWLENYGHWGFPGEFLQYGGQSMELGGEFWSSGDLGNIELRAASSAVHIYGKPRVSAESFTSGGPHFTLDPWALRKRGDWSITEGVSHAVFHVYIHQPSDRSPGINAWFGTEFNRNNTWFEQGRDWIAYLRRAHGLLQQGKYVADVAYFIGEDTPKMTGVRDPALPAGYSFDYVNAEVIEKRMEVKNGRFVLPDGMSYRLLVLPPLDTMRPELLRKLEALVAAGGVILGPPPSKSPSMQNYPAGDREVRRLAARIWRKCDGKKVTSVAYGKGKVFCGVNLETAFADMKVTPDVAGLEPKKFPWIHRTATEGDVYFISNQGDQAASVEPGFRVAGRQPELWDAATAERRELPEFRVENGRTMVPLQFAPRQSLFVVFRKPAATTVPGRKNFPAPATLGSLDGEWAVHFDPKWGGPESVVFSKLEDWTLRPEEGIKYYSGTAVYRKTFDLPESAGRGRMFLDLGEVHSMARVRLNGQDMGLVWAAPWRVDITGKAKPKGNELEIEVVNTWLNRLAGDLKLPESERHTWIAIDTIGAHPKLLPAGLLGPVTVETIEY